MVSLCARLSLTSAKHNAPEVIGYFLKFPGKNTCRSESLNSFPKVTHQLPLDFGRRFQSSPMASLHLPGGSGRGRQACSLGGRHNWVFRPSIKCHWAHPCSLSKMLLHSVFFGCFIPHLGEGLNKLLMALSSFIWLPWTSPFIKCARLWEAFRILKKVGCVLSRTCHCSWILFPWPMPLINHDALWTLTWPHSPSQHSLLGSNYKQIGVGTEIRSPMAILTTMLGLTQVHL